ncbi:MAG TPA: CsgG/HfaB family protein, partial [bacterium]|nr:CsgG/HfaB family protein [bacterium]
AGVAIKKEEAYIQATLRLIDVRTRRVINSTTVEGKASKAKLGLAAGGVAGPVILGGGFEKYKNTPTAQAVGIMVENAVKEVVRMVPEDYYKYTGKPVATGYKNEPDGFRGIKWGTAFSSLTGMKPVKDEGNIKQCQKENESLLIGKAQLERIIYSFYKEQLESVTAETRGKENFEKLKVATQERFGPGNQKSENEWRWEGTVTSISLQFVPAEEKGFLKMSSEEMKKKMESDTGF